MKKMMILSGAAALVLSSCGTASPTLKTQEDSVAYVMGLDFGAMAKGFDSTINIDVVAAAMKDVMEGKEQIDKEAAHAFIQEYMTVILPAKKGAQARAEGAEFLEKVAAENKNAQKTESGLLYEIVEAGDASVKARPTDKVKVKYKGTLKDGSEFDNSEKHGGSVEFPLDRVIPGWTEGIQLIGKGGKIKLWIPADLAYGDNPNGPGGPGQTLAFEVELLDVIPVDTTATK